MAENCKQNRPDIEKENIDDNQEQQTTVPYKEPAKDSNFYGLESHFNQDVIIYGDVRIHGDLKANFSNLRNRLITVKNLNVLKNSVFDGYSYFSDYVYGDKGFNVGILTARDKLDVGCGGTTLRANASNGRVGIGSTVPQQKLDVAGSVKIDETIYDSSNSSGRNGYYVANDERGVRWIPLVAESIPGVPGIATEGVFVLNEGVPLYQP